MGAFVEPGLGHYQAVGNKGCEFEFVLDAASKMG